MRIVSIVARVLLGLLFLVAGANKVIPFMPSGPLPAGPAAQFVDALVSTKYFLVVGLFESISGILLLINRFVPLALTTLAAIIVNILLTGILMAPKGIGAGVVVTILWLVVFYRVRANFSGLFQARTES